MKCILLLYFLWYQRCTQYFQEEQQESSIVDKIWRPLSSGGSLKMLNTFTAGETHIEDNAVSSSYAAGNREQDS